MYCSTFTTHTRGPTWIKAAAAATIKRNEKLSSKIEIRPLSKVTAIVATSYTIDTFVESVLQPDFSEQCVALAGFFV